MSSRLEIIICFKSLFDDDDDDDDDDDNDDDAAAADYYYSCSDDDDEMMMMMMMIFIDLGAFKPRRFVGSFGALGRPKTPPRYPCPFKH